MSAFARRYLRNQCLFLFLQVLRCFSSLRSLCIPMNSACSDWVLPQTRFRIQKSPDQHLFASSPEHIAGYHVFHRLSMPRHPPYTLSSLTTFIDHRHRCLIPPANPCGRTCGHRSPLARRADEDETNVDNGSHSPKRCSTTPTHGKTIVGITISRGWSRGGNQKPTRFRPCGRGASPWLP